MQKRNQKTFPMTQLGQVVRLAGQARPTDKSSLVLSLRTRPPAAASITPRTGSPMYGELAWQTAIRPIATASRSAWSAPPWHCSIITASIQPPGRPIFAQYSLRIEPPSRYAIGSLGPPRPDVFPPVFWLRLVDTRLQTAKPPMRMKVANASRKSGCAAMTSPC